MEVLFDGVEPLIRILVVGSASYLFLLLAIRWAGPRALGRMQSFDLIIAVAIGSTFGRLLTAEDVQLDEALVAIALLVGLHYLISVLSYRWPRFADWIEIKPVLVFYQGKPLPREMRRNRLTEEELRVAARRHGFDSLDEVAAIVLEADGSFSVLPLRKPPQDRPAPREPQGS